LETRSGMTTFILCSQALRLLLSFRGGAKRRARNPERNSGFRLSLRSAGLTAVVHQPSSGKMVTL
jgi:hypothetical protein